MLTCKKCGAKLQPEDSFCPQCGELTEQKEVPPEGEEVTLPSEPPGTEGEMLESQALTPQEDRVTEDREEEIYPQEAPNEKEKEGEPLPELSFHTEELPQFPKELEERKEPEWIPPPDPSVIRKKRLRLVALLGGGLLLVLVIVWVVFFSGFLPPSAT